MCISTMAAKDKKLQENSNSDEHMYVLQLWCWVDKPLQYIPHLSEAVVTR